MRTPNPPKVILDALNSEQQRKVIKLALRVVAQLAEGNDWGVYEDIESANLELEDKHAF